MLWAAAPRGRAPGSYPCYVPPGRRRSARLGPGFFAIVCAVLSLIPFVIATVGTPERTWPTVHATASGCHAVLVHTDRGHGYEATACQMRWTDENGSARSAEVNYPLGEVKDGAVREVRVSGSRAVDPGTVWAGQRSALLIGGGLLLLAAFLGRRWRTRRRPAVRR